MSSPRTYFLLAAAVAAAATTHYVADAFLFPQHQPSSVARLAAASTLEGTATATSRRRTKAEVAEAQQRAEDHARSNHDAFAMNALFVNVPERPQPTPCSVASESPSSALPADLPRGALLRIGPNGATPDMGFLDGDGMVHCITLPPPDGGDMMYSATYVETNGRKLEQARRDRQKDASADDAVFSGTLGAAPRGLPMLASLLRNGLTFGTLEVQKDTCNTALAVSGDRVLALMEQSPPSEVEFTKQGAMRTVSSMERLGGAVPYAPINGGSLGAHGRTDSVTGDRIHVSYTSSERPFVRVDTFGEGWKAKSSRGVDVPTPVMVHDCALTEHFVVILDFPLTIRPARMIADKFPVEFEPENGSRIGLVPRSNSGDTIWIEVENGVVLHAANAYEREDGTVVVHAFKSTPNGDSSYILEYCPAFLYEWVLDMKARRVVEEHCLNPDVLVEFPNLENGLVGKACKHTFGLVTTSIGGPLTQYSTPQSAVLLDAVVKFDLDDDDEAGIKAGDVAGRFDLPSGWHFVSEPHVVTKTGGDGQYVLLIATYVPPVDGRKSDPVVLASDGCSMKSQLLVIDGNDMSKAVFVADLPYHVNYGLHSEYVGWDIMK